MGTFAELSVGDRFASEPRALDAETARAIVEAGGYTHPLFVDPEFAARSAFGRAPIPGQGVLLVMGGLAESTERFDGTTIGLVGLDDVRFLKPAFAGDAVRLDVEVVAKEPSARTGVLAMRWRCLNDGGEVLVEATARMLFRLDGAD
jgi:acyl dehydratase